MKELQFTRALALLAVLIATAAAADLCSSTPANGTMSTFRFCKELNALNSVVLRWNMTSDTITFGIQATSSGWVSVGISGNGGMKGADMTVLRNVNSQPVAEDRYSTDFNAPLLDAVQNSKLISYSRTGSKVEAVFSRPLVACEADKDMTIDDRILKVIWAVGSSDTFGYHTARGAMDVNFFNVSINTKPNIPYAAGTLTTDIKVNSFTIPAQDTFYACSQYTLPSDRRYHITGWDPIIDKADYVHHFVLFACDVGASVSVSGVQNCDVTPAMASCRTFFLVWAPGSNGTRFPDTIGLPFGQSDYTTFILQTHYNNPSVTSGVVDSSGLRLHYTPNLRPVEAGVASLGIDMPDISIPARSNYYAMTSTCSRLETQYLPFDVTLHSVILHMHTAGVAMSLKVRDPTSGAEEVLSSNGIYDFNLQDYSYPKTGAKLKRGWDWVTTCAWNTASRSTVTRGGEATTKEMCYAFVLYSPRVTQFISCTPSNRITTSTTPPMVPAATTTGVCTAVPGAIPTQPPGTNSAAAAVFSASMAALTVLATLFAML